MIDTLQKYLRGRKEVRGRGREGRRVNNNVVKNSERSELGAEVTSVDGVATVILVVVIVVSGSHNNNALYTKNRAARRPNSSQY